MGNVNHFYIFSQTTGLKMLRIDGDFNMQKDAFQGFTSQKHLNEKKGSPGYKDNKSSIQI